MKEYFIDNKTMTALAAQTRRLCNIDNSINIAEILEYLSKLNGNVIEPNGEYLVQVLQEGIIIKSANLNSGQYFALPITNINVPKGYALKWISNTPMFSNGLVVVENNDIEIEAIVDTASTATEFDISIDTVPHNVTVPVSGYTTIDWGDGTIDSETTHIYNNIGDFTVKFYNATNCVENIANKGWLNCNRIRLSRSITSLEEKAFYGMKIKSIDIMPTINDLGRNTFYSCSNLTNIRIPDSVKSIGGSAFRQCTNLQNIIIGKGVISIDDLSFGSHYFLETIIVSAENPVYHSKDNCLIHTEQKCLILGCQNSVIPDDESVTSIGYGAFSESRNLQNITIPDNITTIDGYAFYRCTNLQSITIGKGIKTIKYNAFQDCNSLTSVVYQGTKEEWKSVTVNGGNTSLTNVLTFAG